MQLRETILNHENLCIECNWRILNQIIWQSEKRPDEIREMTKCHNPQRHLSQSIYYLNQNWQFRWNCRYFLYFETLHKLHCKRCIREGNNENVYFGAAVLAHFWLKLWFGQWKRWWLNIRKLNILEEAVRLIQTRYVHWYM